MESPGGGYPKPNGGRLIEATQLRQGGAPLLPGLDLASRLGGVSV